MLYALTYFALPISFLPLGACNMGQAKRQRDRLGSRLPMAMRDATGAHRTDIRYGGGLAAYIAELIERGDKTTEVKIPCKGCTQCCWHPLLAVEPDKEPPERLAKLDTAPHPEDNSLLMLRKRPDGAGVHLGENGCTVYDDRPQGCRTYD